MKIRITAAQASVICLVCSLAVLAGCSKEKAEALKNAAAQFRAEAVGALGQIRNLLKQSVSFPSETQDQVIDRLVRDLKDPSPLDAKALSFLLNEQAIGQETQKRIDEELDPLEAKYHQFAAMFDSLPQGSYLAAKSVKQAERHAINLTLEFLAFAKTLKTQPFQFTGARVALIEEINKAKRFSDESQKTEILKVQARALLALFNQEKRAQEQAVLQCLKAAESCRNVAELIRGYNQLSVSDILTMSREFLSFAASVSGGNSDVTALLARYQGVEETIRSDPYWNEILNLK